LSLTQIRHDTSAKQVYRAPKRTLDDEELDSGDDQDRMDRIADEEEAQLQEEEQEQTIMEAALGRQPVPEPSDGEVSHTAAARP